MAIVILGEMATDTTAADGNKMEIGPKLNLIGYLILMAPVTLLIIPLLPSILDCTTCKDILNFRFYCGRKEIKCNMMFKYA